MLESRGTHQLQSPTACVRAANAATTTKLTLPAAPNVLTKCLAFESTLPKVARLRHRGNPRGQESQAL